MTAIYGLCAEGTEDIDELDASLEQVAQPAMSPSITDADVQAQRRAAIAAMGGGLGG